MARDGVFISRRGSGEGLLAFGILLIIPNGRISNVLPRNCSCELNSRGRANPRRAMPNSATDPSPVSPRERAVVPSLEPRRDNPERSLKGLARLQDDQLLELSFLLEVKGVGRAQLRFRANQIIIERSVDNRVIELFVV